MKVLLLFVLLFSFSMINAQEVKPSYELAGDQVKVTYYFEDGAIYKQGFFKDKKLSGKWLQFDQKGNKVASGFYKDGKKVGTWFQWTNNKLREINYDNNIIKSVSIWREDTKLALNR
ncbi:MAG: Uncharacterised protein [Flavobacterium sp. SCGC AAA160-P02]|nr:MAG: Uncharacterised protein [Flavobacterium sp. SCGC AAA160-P02]